MTNPNAEQNSSSTDAPSTEVANLGSEIFDTMQPSQEDTTTQASDSAETPSTDVVAAMEETPAPAATPEATIPASGTTEATQPQAQAQVANPEAELLAQIQAANAALNPPTQQEQTPAAQQPTQTQETGDYIDSLVPKYDFAIPDQLAAYLNSDDPAERMQGIRQTMQGVARTVHKETMTQVREIIRSMHQALPEIINQATAYKATEKNVNTDFYGTYPELQNEALKPVIKHVFDALTKETGTIHQWTPEVRDLLAKRVYGVLGRPVPQPQGQVQQQVTPPPVQTPPAMMQGSNGGSVQAGRGTEGKQPQSNADEIFATFNHF